MRRELSQILAFDIKDPGLGFVTVTSIEVSKDLRHAKAFISCMGTESQKKKCLYSLIKAKGYIQKELGQRLSMKFIPDVKFILDSSLDHLMHIDAVLKKIKEDDAAQKKENEHES